jgi:transposase
MKLSSRAPFNAFSTSQPPLDGRSISHRFGIVVWARPRVRSAAAGKRQKIDGRYNFSQCKIALAEYQQLQAQIDEVEAKLASWQKTDECSQRLVKIPGVGPIGAALLRMKTPAPELFRSGRQFAAWMGLTPKDHSTAGKVRLGVITRAGDEALRAVLVSGAMSIIKTAQNGRGKNAFTPWIEALLLKGKKPKLVAVALANKIARIAWKLMVTGESYATKSAPAATASAA